MTSLGEDLSADSLSGLVCGLHQDDVQPRSEEIGFNFDGPMDESGQNDCENWMNVPQAIRESDAPIHPANGGARAGDLEVSLPGVGPEPKRSARGWVMAAVWSLCLAVSAFSFWKGNSTEPPPSVSRPPTQLAANTPAVLPASEHIRLLPDQQPKLVTRPIEEIRPGMRVIAENPGLEERLPDTKIVPADWRLVSVMREEEHGRFESERLFPVSWLKDNQVEVGSQVDLNLSEIELHGQVTVTGISDCPPLEADDGTGRRLVTAVFRHVADNVIDVTIDGEPEPIGCTSNHPFWSHDRNDFVEAGTLAIGEHVLSHDGTPRAITRITPHRGPPVTVYNFEVDVEHVYVVGENGLLVHNSCAMSTAYNTNGSISSVSATVRFADLGSGTGTTRAARALTEVGDDAGHLIARQLGGRGGAGSGNIISMNRKLNRGEFAQFESEIAGAIRGLGTSGSARVNIILQYGSGSSTKPVKIIYEAILNDGTRLAHRFSNF
jgi:hypothetical protein